MLSSLLNQGSQFSLFQGSAFTPFLIFQGHFYPLYSIKIEKLATHMHAWAHTQTHTHIWSLPFLWCGSAVVWKYVDLVITLQFRSRAWHLELSFCQLLLGCPPFSLVQKLDFKVFWVVFFFFFFLGGGCLFAYMQPIIISCWTISVKGVSKSSKASGHKVKVSVTTGKMHRYFQFCVYQHRMLATLSTIAFIG